MPELFGETQRSTATESLRQTMKPMTEKQAARWQRQRAQGKWIFIIKNTLILSFVWLVCASLGIYLIGGNITQELLVTQLAISLIFAGLLNLRIWGSAEASYQSFLFDKENKDFNQ